MQNKNSLSPELCGSRAAEDVSGILWILTELINDLQIISHNPRKPTPHPQHLRANR